MGFYLELIRTVFQAVDGRGKLRNRVVAFTSATRGEGVSYVVNLMAKELAAQTQKRVLLVDAEALGTLNLADPSHISNHCEETEIDNLLTLSVPQLAPAHVVAARGFGGASDWDSSSEYRKSCLDALRWNFDYVLIDCPSPAVSSEAITLAPIIDGVAIVVKAAQTRRSQIQYCQDVLKNAGEPSSGLSLTKDSIQCLAGYIAGFNRGFILFIRRIVAIALLTSTLTLAVYAQKPAAQRQRQSAQTPQTPKLGVFGSDVRYTLNPGDVLDIQYRYTPEFNQTVTVQPDGYISLQIGGDVKVSGRDLTQVRTLILAQVRTRLESPEITVILKEFQKPYVVVAGEVVTPGKLEMRERLTALQAVLTAGGFKDSAKSSQVIVFRKLNADMAEVKILNFKSLTKTSDLENDLTLQAGDMILVPRNKISKIERYVRIASMAAWLRF